MRKKISFFIPFSLLFLLLATVGCAKKPPEGELHLAFDKSGEDSVFIYTYASRSVLARPFSTAEPIVLPSYEGEDTVLVHLIYRTNEELLFPLLPSNKGERVTYSVKKGETRLKAGKETPNSLMLLFAQELGMPPVVNDVTEEKLLTLVTNHPDEAASHLYRAILQDSLEQHDKSAIQKLDSLLMGSETRFRHLERAIYPNRFNELSPRENIRYRWLDNYFYSPRDKTPKEKRRKLEDAWKKQKDKRALVVAYWDLPTDSASLAQEKAWQLKADSLKLPVVALYLDQDTVPKDLIKKRKTKKAFFTLADTMVLATFAAEELGVKQFPEYMVLDSLYYVRERFHHPDSVLSYLNQPQEE